MFDLDWYKLLVWIGMLVFCICFWLMGFKLGSKLVYSIFGG